MISTPAPVTSRAVLQHIEDLRLHGDIERSGRFVADDQVGVVGDGDRDDDALAFAAGQLVRERLRARRRAGVMPTSSSSSTARARAARRLGVAAGGSAVPRRSGRRRCTPGSAPTSDPGTPCRCSCRGSPTSRWSARPSSSSPCSRTDPGDVGVLGQQADDGHRGRGLARAGFADERHHLARDRRGSSCPRTAATSSASVGKCDRQIA